MTTNLVGTGCEGHEAGQGLWEVRRSACLGGVGAVESRSILVKDRESVVRVQCDECGGSAHFVTRSPHPLDGLETRTFECLECRHQTQRIVTE